MGGIEEEEGGDINVDDIDIAEYDQEGLRATGSSSRMMASERGSDDDLIGLYVERGDARKRKDSLDGICGNAVTL